MYIDIAANLSDLMFQGVYHEKPKHQPDLEAVIQRAADAACYQMIVLAGSLTDAKVCLNICRKYTNESVSLSTTIGIHPTRGDELFQCISRDLSEQELQLFIRNEFLAFSSAAEHRLVAIGELGLDYDRLHFCSAEVQKLVFELQLKAGAELQLPLLLHLRNETAFHDFIDIIQRNKYAWENNYGVIHSFTGSRKEMDVLTQLGFYIGINGCSLRSEEFLRDVLPNIPIDKIVYETDAPYCEIKPTHPSYKYLNDMKLPGAVKPEKYVQGSMVKSRNEPACINQVAHVVARVKQIDPVSLSEIVRNNTWRLFRKIPRL